MEKQSGRIPRWICTVGHGLASLIGLVQGILLVQKTRLLESMGFLFFVVFLMSGLSFVFLLRNNRTMPKFVKFWNWILLPSSFLAVWLGASPETRLGAFCLLVFATLATTIA